MKKLIEFDAFVEHFKTTPQWQSMVNTVEASPWHREANVAVHTEMVMQQFRDRFAMKKYGDHHSAMALTALLFHDTGKPSAEEVVEKKDGSGDVYRRYGGHEADSAVTFQEFYMNSPQLQGMFNPMEARAIRWMIEHHLPYALKDKQKRQNLAISTNKSLTRVQAPYELFFDVLRSDAAGRISDDHETKLQNVEDWIAEFSTISTEEPYFKHTQYAFVLVGPSGSGKSSWCKVMMKPNDKRVSYDDLKIAFWKLNHEQEQHTMTDPVELYNVAWKYATIDYDKEFRAFADQFVRQAFQEAKEAGGDVYIDVVNGPKKKRTIFIDYAKRYGFAPMGVEFWNRFETLVERQKTRGDKSVPTSSIRQQVNATASCWEGSEVMRVIMVLEVV